MGTHGMVGIGAILICGVALSACGGDRDAHVKAAFKTTIGSNGGIGFTLVLDRDAWQIVSAHPPGMTSEVLDKRVHAAVRFLVEKGMAGQATQCPGKWVYDRIIDMPDGGMMFTGYCVSDSELKATSVDSGI